MSSNCSLCFFSYFRYREAGVSEWSTIPVTPPGSTQVTINRLSSGTTYEFQVVGKNEIGDGMLSKVITVRTLGEWHVNNIASMLSDINHVNYIFNVYVWLSILNGSAIHSDLTLWMVQFICSDSDFCTSVAVKNFLFALIIVSAWLILIIALCVYPQRYVLLLRSCAIQYKVVSHPQMKQGYYCLL